MASKALIAPTIRTYHTSGHLLDLKTHTAVAGLRIEAWDKALISHDLVAVDTSDTTGAFDFTLSSGYLRQLFVDRRPVLFFRVFQGTRLVASTETTAVWFVLSPETKFR